MCNAVGPLAAIVHALIWRFEAKVLSDVGEW